jgi:hypothetical protein
VFSQSTTLWVYYLVLEPVLQPNGLCYMTLLQVLCSVYSWFAGQCTHGVQNEYPLFYFLYFTNYNIILVRLC